MLGRKELSQGFVGEVKDEDILRKTSVADPLPHGDTIFHCWQRYWCRQSLAMQCHQNDVLPRCRFWIINDHVSSLASDFIFQGKFSSDIRELQFRCRRCDSICTRIVLAKQPCAVPGNPFWWTHPAPHLPSIPVYLVTSESASVHVH